MREIKDTQRASVRISYTGNVHKKYKGPSAERRYLNEVRVLRYLEEKGCSFVPKLLEAFEDELYTVTTNCGSIADRISDGKAAKIFAELEDFGVKHDDPFPRNITYDSKKGRFCVIDFEFAVILESGEGLKLEDTARKKWKK